MTNILIARFIGSIITFEYQGVVKLQFDIVLHIYKNNFRIVLVPKSIIKQFMASLQFPPRIAMDALML